MNTSTAPTTLTTTTTRWKIDPGHSAVGFSVRHMMITNVRGEFRRFGGEVVHDPAHPEITRVEATIDVASVDTREPKRDDDLRSDLFFHAEGHPAMTFVSRSATPVGDDGLDLLGDLTLRGVTREVTLAVRDLSAPRLDMRNNRRMGATASTRIRRADFGMTWNKTLDAGGVVVGEIVTVSLEISLVAVT